MVPQLSFNPIRRLGCPQSQSCVRELLLPFDRSLMPFQNRAYAAVRRHRYRLYSTHSAGY